VRSRFAISVLGLVFALLGATGQVHAQKQQDGGWETSVRQQLEAAGAVRRADANPQQGLRRLRRWLASPSVSPEPSEAEQKLLGDPEAIRAEQEKLKAWLTDYANQRKLIASGALNGEVGNVSLDRLRQAIVDLRLAIGSNAAGMVTAEEMAALNSAEAEIDAFAKFGERLNPKTNAPVYLPLGLVSDTFEPDPGDPNNLDPTWTTFSSADKKIRVDELNYRLASETPVSLATLLLEKRQGLSFDVLDLTGNTFKIEASALARDGAGREYLAFGGRELKGSIEGYGLRVSLQPPEGLQVPQLRVALPPDAKKEARAASPASPEENWRAVVKVLRNLLASRHNEADSYKPISRQACAGVETSEQGAVKTVRILYATDRKPLYTQPVASPLDLGAMFSSDLDSTKLHLGCLEVEVRSTGSSQAVGNYSSGIKQLYEKRVLDRPITVKKFTPMAQSVDFKETKRLVFRSDEVSGYERALLYIHGYNNGFADAVRHVANIAAASEYTGQVYMFSWPSAQRVVNYAPDMDLAEQSEVHLSAFMKAIASSGDLVGLDIVAHSMGSQILLRTLDGLRPMLDRRLSRVDRFDRFRLGQIVFAAPDVSSLVFAQKVQPFTYFADRVTVYASSNDGVLGLSSWLRAEVPRAGYIANGLPLRAGASVHVVDISRKFENRYLFGRVCGNYHAAFIYDPAVLEDIAQILKQGQSPRSAVRRATPERRAAIAGAIDKFKVIQYPPDGQESASKYWALQPGYGLPPEPPKTIWPPNLTRLQEDLCTNL
jgi:esterase/lipase superfamily enzyme